MAKRIILKVPKQPKPLPESRFLPAHEIEALVERISAQHHPHLVNRDEVRIVSVFNAGKMQKAGKLVLAKTRRLSPLEAYLSGEEVTAECSQFLLIVNLSAWLALTSAQHEALVDHELQHVSFDADTETFSLLGHDIEDFSVIIERHGLWTPDLRVFGDAVGQQLAFEGVPS